MKTLMEIRNEKKKRKPLFRAQDSWKRKSLRSDSWRRPRGLHSKIRRGFKGNPRMPSPGYRAPIAVRGFHPSGVKAILVKSLSQLSEIKEGGIIIAKSIGAKKKLEAIKQAQAKKLSILNIDGAKYSESVKKKLNERKTAAKERTAKKAKPKADEKKEPAAKPEAKEISEEDKRKEAIKETEKVITKRN